jgi:DNA cross-link repair 1A protein
MVPYGLSSCLQFSTLQMVGFHQLYDKASRELEHAKASLQPEPLFIRPSTQWYAICARSQKPSLTEAEQDEYGVWHVCFSIHSSRDELEQALQLLQPQWVISTTPPCFAIELSYVKKHCFKTRLTADDPLWKIFRDPFQKSMWSPCSVLASETHTDKDHSDFVDEDDHSSSSSEESTYLNVSTIELKFVPSPPPEEPDITLFGRARFGSQAINIMKEELCNQYIAFEGGCLEEARTCAPADFVHGNSEVIKTDSAANHVVKQAAASHRDHIDAGDEMCSSQHGASSRQLEGFQAPSLPTVRRNISVCADQHEKFEAAIESKALCSSEDSSLSMVRSGETTNCEKEPLSMIGSSQCLNPSLKRLYRSRNIPVPRPLPSLVKLLESSKRVKMQQSTNYSLLNSRHSLP